MRHSVYSYATKDEAIEAGKILSDELNKKGYLTLAEWNNIQEKFLGRPTTTQPEVYFNKGWTDDEDFYLDEMMGVFVISCCPPYDISMARRRYERLTTPEPKKKIIRCVKVIQNTNIKYFEKNVEEFLASITPEYQINYQHEVAHDELHDKDTVYHFATITYNMEVDDNE